MAKNTKSTDEVTEVIKKKTTKAKADVPEVAETEAVVETVAEEATEARTTKAGPKSAKAIAEAEAKTAKKTVAENAKAAGPKPAAPRTKRVIWHGKKYRAVAKLIDATRVYELAEAIALAQQTATTKFDSTVELHINLGVDPRQADQMVRASVVLPAGTGKTQRIAVIAPADQQAAAKTAGADLVGEDDIIKRIERGQFDFDLLITTPAAMPKLGKLAKVLGPKGLMPNPKSGTVTTNLAQAVSEAKAGRIEFRIDKQAIVHQAIGKVSFKPEQLLENAITLIGAVMAAKPAAAKGSYVLAMAATTSMGPGIKIDHTAAIAQANQAR